MTLVGGIKYQDKIIVYGDSKISGAVKNVKPAIKINHYGNIIVATTGLLMYAQLWNLFVNSGEYVLQDSLVRRLVQNNLAEKKYKWSSEIIFALFISFYDWIRKRDLGYKLEEDVLGSVSFLVATETDLYNVTWGAIESATPYLNIGSGAQSADSIIETVSYLKPKIKEDEKVELFLKTLVNVCPTVSEGVDAPFYLCSPCASSKKEFYILNEHSNFLTIIKDEKEIDNYFEEMKKEMAKKKR